MRTRTSLLALMSLALAACGSFRASVTAAPQAAQPAPSLTTTPLPPPATRTQAPPTPTASRTPSPTITPTPTPTLHPLAIEWLRQHDYPASGIVIEETLEPGPNYYRYIASYRSEGLKINALLTVPYGERPASGWPVIIFNHGYIPPDQYRTTERYVAYVDGFARSGYIVFRSDYRGHADSEGVARGAYGSSDYVVDVLNAVEAMKAYPDADPDRIGMWGHSMGGYITLRAMVTSLDIKAGVIWAGVVASYPDLMTRWRRGGSSATSPTPRPNSWRSGLTQAFGSPQSNPAFWDSISANAYLKDLSGPVQLHHGTADTSVPIEFSRLLDEQIRAAGGVVEYYEYEGDDHNLSNLFTQAMLRSIAFFNKYVKGE
jgi:uncharacterized protein